MKAGRSSELDDHLTDKPKTGLALGLTEAAASHDRVLNPALEVSTAVIHRGACGLSFGFSASDLRFLLAHIIARSDRWVYW